MSGTVIGTEPCSRCTGTMRYSETSSGGISGSCDTCKRQTFDRSPKACEGIKRKLSGSGKPAGQPAAGESASKPAAFDLSKL